MLEGEISSQLQKFITAFGRLPDFIDGHQHVHLFPQIREALLTVVKDIAPNVWVRQCGRIGPLHKRVAGGKAIALDMLSSSFRRLANRHGVRVNPAFAGTSLRRIRTMPRSFPSFFAGCRTGAW
jgi:chitin disaccharide deacetylase